MSNCSKCNSVCNSDDCGCTPVGLTTPNYCITDTPICPDPEPCSEITDANCLIYTGPDILCGTTPIIETNDSISDAFVALATLACATASGGVSQIIAGANITISTLGPSPGVGIVTINADCCDVYFADILGDAYLNTSLLNYFNLKQNILTAGPGILISGTTISAVGGLGTVTNVSTVFTQAGTSPSLSVANPTSTPIITLNLPLASGSASSGLLSSINWNTFNGKQNPITLSTNGTNGASTWNALTSTLNIPVYQAQFTVQNNGSGAATYNSINNVLNIPNNSFNLGITDGTTAVSNVTGITFVGATISGTSPNGVVTLSASSGYNLIQKTASGVTTSFTQRSKLNFLGSSVSIADNSGALSTDVSIQAYNLIQGPPNSSPLTQRSIINFTGTGVTVTDDSINLRTIVNVSSAVPINRNVYVMQNGNDITGVVQRLDLPFATIAAARTAALAYWNGVIAPVPTETNRIKIVVETGIYNETIVIHDFIDYDLQDSTIIAPAFPSIAPCIIDKGSFYILPTNGRYTSMIYGNATFISGQNQTCLSITSTSSQNISLYIKCNHLNNIVVGNQMGTAVKINTGKVTIDAQYISSGNVENNDAVIILGTDSSYTVSGIAYPPKVEIFNAKIYNSQNALSPAIFPQPYNHVIGITNNVLTPAGGDLTGANPVKLMLKNCEIGSFTTSTTLAAIGVDPSLGGYLDLTLKNTSIYVYNTGSVLAISQTSSPAVGLVKVWCQGGYGNVGVNVTPFAVPPNDLQVFDVDANLQFNQGIRIS